MLSQRKIPVSEIADKMGDIQQVANYDGNDAGNRLESLVRDIDYDELKTFPKGTKLFVEDVEGLTETLYSHPRVKLCYAMLLERLNQPTLAADVYKEILANCKTYWRAYFYSANLAMQQGQLHVAKNILLEMKNLPGKMYISPSLRPEAEDNAKLCGMLSEVKTRIEAGYTGKNKRKKEQRRAQASAAMQQPIQQPVQQQTVQPLPLAQQPAGKGFFATLVSISSAFFTAAERLSDDLSANGQLTENRSQTLKRSR